MRPSPARGSDEQGKGHHNKRSGGMVQPPALAQASVHVVASLLRSRLPLQVPVVFDAATAELVSGECPVRPLGPVAVKGMGDIPIYTLGSGPSESA